jgi:hypothetical protein
VSHALSCGTCSSQHCRSIGFDRSPVSPERRPHPLLLSPHCPPPVACALGNSTQFGHDPAQYGYAPISDTAKSDIDVMVVSASLSYAELFGALETATASLGRSVNPTLYSPSDIAKRRAQDSAFVTRVLASRSGKKGPIPRKLKACCTAAWCV